MAFDLLAVAKDKSNKKLFGKRQKNKQKNLNQIKSKPENTHKKSQKTSKQKQSEQNWQTLSKSCTERMKKKQNSHKM